MLPGRRGKQFHPILPVKPEAFKLKPGAPEGPPKKAAFYLCQTSDVSAVFKAVEAVEAE
jgi:hypothetical protein